MSTMMLLGILVALSLPGCSEAYDSCHLCPPPCARCSERAGFAEIKGDTPHEERVGEGRRGRASLYVCAYATGVPMPNLGHELQDVGGIMVVDPQLSCELGDTLYALCCKSWWFTPRLPPQL